MRVRQLTIAWLLASALPAQAQQETPAPAPVEPLRTPAGRDLVRLAFNFYRQSDGSGTPNADERMTVLEPMVLVTKAVDPRWTLSLKLRGDAISAASTDSNGGSGLRSIASADRYFGAEAHAFYAWHDRLRLGVGASGSIEQNYRSSGLHVRAVLDTPSLNDTFLFKLSVLRDTLDVIRFDDAREGRDTRETLSPGFGWTRILGPRTVGVLNYDLTLQKGFLHTPGNSVLLGATESTEELPSSRTRHSVFLRVRHLLAEDLAVEPGLGFYVDDWGASAFHVEVRASWEAIPSSLILEPRYRFHVQGEVDHFLDEGAPALPEFRTQDPDLGSFGSHAVGVKAILLRAPFLSEDMELSITAEFARRTDGVDALSLSVGYAWRF